MKFFPPIKTPDNASYWPFESMEALALEEESVRRQREAVTKSKSGYTFERFLEFLAAGEGRSPKLYRGEAGGGEKGPGNAVFVRSIPLPVAVDNKSRAAGEEREEIHQESREEEEAPGILGDWDSIETEEGI